MAYSRYHAPSMFGRSWWDPLDHPSSFFDYPFGNNWFQNDLLPPSQYGHLLRPRTHAALQTSGPSKMKNDEDKFQVMLNVSHFKPYELDVKVVDDYVVVRGKHEEKTDEHGFIEREFTRRYKLPEGVESEAVKSSLSGNSVLTIEAPKKGVEAPPANERVVPVVMSKSEAVEDEK